MSSKYKEKYEQLLKVEDAIFSLYQKMIYNEKNNINNDKYISYLKMSVEVENNIIDYLSNGSNVNDFYRELISDNNLMVDNNLDYIFSGFVDIKYKRILNKIVPYIVDRRFNYYRDSAAYSPEEGKMYYYISDFDEFMQMISNQCILPVEQFDLNQEVDVKIDSDIINNLYVYLVNEVGNKNNKILKTYNDTGSLTNFKYNLSFINPYIENELISNKFNFSKLKNYDINLLSNISLMNVHPEYIQNHLLSVYSSILYSSSLDYIYDSNNNVDNLNHILNLLIIEYFSKSFDINVLSELKKQILLDAKEFCEVENNKSVKVISKILSKQP